MTRSNSGDAGGDVPTLIAPPKAPESSASPRQSNDVLDFTEIGRGDVARVGGKGANLGEMVRAHLPVPAGFVVAVNAYERAMSAAGTAEQLRSLLSALNVDDAEALRKASESAQRIVREAEIPEETRSSIAAAYQRLCGDSTDAPVAIRSSATAEDAPSASFAGMFESFLLVRGIDDVLARIRDCWASAFGARVLFYRVKQSQSGGMPVAVVVQRMVMADRSGVMFSVDPSTHDESRIVIEATRGLGEPVVQGQVTPDRYILDKTTLGVREMHIAAKQFTLVADPKTGRQKRVDAIDPERVLSDSDLVILASLAVRAEEYFGAPQDMEFAIETTAVHLVQTRPITTLQARGAPKAEAAAQPAERGEIVARGLGASPGTASGAVRLLENPAQGAAMQQGEILVSHMTSPDWVPLMRKAAAIVTDAGGMTSHAAIVSRELGVPCVVGTRDATRVLRSGMTVTVDGAAGTVATGAKAAPRAPAAQAAPPGAMVSEASPAARRAPIVTSTRLYVNLADPTQAADIAARDVDGVGLLRAEVMLVEALGGTHPKQLLAEGKRDTVVERLATPLTTIAQAFYPRPVIYRAMDFRSNEFRALRGGDQFEPEESNPMIGYRGCFRYVGDPALFVAELLALHKTRRQHDNVHLMIPFVRTEWELRECFALLDRSPLGSDRTLQRWIMAEVPSVVWRMKDYAALGVTGISIGSNDLTQLVLGVDRDNERLARLYDERDPAVLAAISEIIREAHRYGLTASICGQAPSVHAEYADFLVRCGIDSISVTPDAIERTRLNVARAEQRLILERARAT